MDKELLYQEFGITKHFTAEALLASIFKSNAASHLKGSSMEHYFRQEVANLDVDAMVEKVPDSDTEQRYDHIIITDYLNIIYTSECKSLTRINKEKTWGYADLCFKDARKVKLPSGKIWETRCRAVHEGFDFLAVSLVNYTGNWKDFAYLRKEFLPLFKCKKGKRPRKIDRKFKESYYYARSVKVPLPIRPPFSTNLTDMFSPIKSQRNMAQIL